MVAKNKIVQQLMERVGDGDYSNDLLTEAMADNRKERKRKEGRDAIYTKIRHAMAVPGDS